MVVDTNVLATANGAAGQAGLACRQVCGQRLREIQAVAKVVLDTRRLIIDEYRRLASSTGQPGPGDAFFRWVLTNVANPERCELVAITPCEDESEFAEFPNDPDLATFDRSDRKFVAVACASRSAPVIVNATDTDWWDHREALRRHGIEIEFLCPELMSQSRRRRGG